MKKNISKTIALILFCFAFISQLQSQSIPLPFETINNSDYADNEIYIAVMGTVNGNFVWLDLNTGQTKQTLTSYNTLTASNGSNYANIFVKLSDLSNNEIDIPIMKSSRVYYSFQKPLYFKFYGANSFYSTPDVDNPSDINYNTKWEFIEFNIGDSGDIWANTSRVDFYQYAIGLELYGTNYYGKVGETMSHDDIINKWQAEAEAPYIPCLDTARELIRAPSNLEKFQSGGLNQNYFGTIVDDIWSRYTNENLKFRDANNHIWEGRVSNNVFTFTNLSTNKTAIINGKPTTHNILSGAGLLWNDYSSTSGNDIDLQKHFTAALNRGVLTADAPANITQDWSVEADFYQSSRYNGYSKFFHSDGVSHNSKTYTFALDDVFDHSSLLTTSKPTKAVITIGGYANSSCATSTLTPYTKINTNGWKSVTSVSLDEGDNIQFGPHPTSGGSWSWSGPNNFSNSSRSFTLSNVNTLNAGTYTATYTNSCGAKSTLSITVSVTSSNSSTSAPIGATIWLKSVSNSQYVCADLIINSNTGPLYANRWSYAGWESFTVKDAGNGLIRLYSAATGKYVKINPNSEIVDSSGGTGTWTAIAWENNSDGTISLKANINNKYVSNNSNSQLLGDTTTKNNNEKFTYGIISQAKRTNEKTNISNSVVTIAPNPAKNSIAISYTYSAQTDITIFNIAGQKILQTKTKDSEVSHINISNFSAGIYLLKITNDEGTTIKKFIRE